MKDSIIKEVRKTDKNQIMQLFSKVNKEDQKFLALDKKLPIIKQNIQQERHIYVAEYDGNIVGFARESGRPNKYVLLEEIVVLDECRGKGIGSSLLQHMLGIYPRMLAKTFANNEKIIALLKKHDFVIGKTSPKGEILYWIHSENMNPKQ